MEHTKGPWTALNSPQGYLITDGGGRDIARLFGIENCDPEFGGGRFGLNDHANARIIASAPEMLEALVRLTSGDLLTAGFYQKVEALIAKARGQ